MRVDSEILTRIENALHVACEVLARFTPGQVVAQYKSSRDPVTEADRAVDRALRECLQRADEDWLSEECLDDRRRLKCKHVWIIDPLDGTAEFVAGIPEWAVSVAFVENGRAIAGGVYNCSTGEIFLGGIGVGVTYNGASVKAASRATLDGALVLASRSEFGRGEWRRFEGRGFTVRPVGSVAYKLALVAAGSAHATWTLSPKHEWDIAGGSALVQAAGGFVHTLDGTPPKFNSPTPRLSGLIAGAPGLEKSLMDLCSPSLAAGASARRNPEA